MRAVVVFEVEKVMKFFWSVGGGVQKSSENRKTSCYAALHHGFELSSPNGVDLTSRKVGATRGGMPFCINVLRVHTGEMPSSVLFSLLFCTPPPTDQKSFITLSTPNTTTAHTQMDLPFVGVQGHQKSLENSKTVMKIDVFCV